MTAAAGPITGLTLDAGALIAIDRNTKEARALVRRAFASRWPVMVPAGALAQAWRDGARQARLAVFLKAKDGPVVVPLDDFNARATGELCGRSGTADVVDASVAVCARSRQDHVVTSDPGDIARLDPALRLIPI